MTSDRYKFGSTVTTKDLKRIEDNIDLMEKSRDAYRRYLIRILRDKMFIEVDETMSMEDLISKIDELGNKWIIEGNKKVHFPAGCNWTNIRDYMYMDSVVIYCRNNGTANNYGKITITGRYLENVDDPRWIVDNANGVLTIEENRYFNYTIDATSMTDIAEPDGGTCFTLYFDPDSHTNGVELKIDGECVEWLCFNTTFTTLLDLGPTTAKRVENIACGPIIMRIKDNTTLEQVVGVRFRTDSEIIAFENCTALKVIDNVDMSYTNPYYRFEGCTSMETAPNFNTAGCPRLDQLFKGCTSLTTIHELDMTKCKNAREMFMGPIGLTSTNVNDKLKNINTLEIAERMFYNTDIDTEIGDFTHMRVCNSMYENNTIPKGSMGAMAFTGDGNTIVNAKNMFAFDRNSASGADKLTSVGAITTTDCSLDMDGFYKGRALLTNANLGISAATKVHGANSLFEGCTGLTSLPVADYSTCVRYSYMYKGCSNIVNNDNITMDFGHLEWSAAYPTSEAIFDGCSKIKGTLTIENMCKPYDFWLTSGGCPTAEAPKFTAVTFTNMTEDVAGCKIAVHNQNMDAAALNAMFESLADVNAKNTERGVESYIIIQGNPGVATCDTTIATNKGWKISTLIDLMTKLATVIITDTGITSYKADLGSEIASIDSNPVPYCEATFKAGKSTELLCESKLAPPAVPPPVEPSPVDLQGEESPQVVGQLYYKCDIYGWDDFTGIKFCKKAQRKNRPDIWDIVDNPNIIGCDYLKAVPNYISLEDLFNRCSKLEKVVDISNWDTSKVTNMHNMFSACSSLTTLDVSNWDTSNVTSMSNMFNECLNLAALDVSNWNVSNVTDMSHIFCNCRTLTTIDISKWNTSKVTDMKGMFCWCNSLTTLDVSNLNTSKVTNMYDMFSYCSKLTTLDVSKWDTGKVVKMEGMFGSCSGLTTLDVSNWNTSNATDISWMFNTCSNLTTLDVSNWNTSKLTTIGHSRYQYSGLFCNCTKLVEIKGINNWDTSNINDFGATFRNCPSLVNLDLSNWNTSKATNMNAMFRDCSSLTTLNVSDWDTSNLTSVSYIFYNCSKLTTLDVSNWNTGNVANMDWMFNNCSSLTTIDVSKWNTSNVTNMSLMFYGCSSLITIDVSKWNTSKVTNMNGMFRNCKSLTTLDVSKWNTGNVANMNWVFGSCRLLTTIDVSKWNTSNVTNMDSMFSGCKSLSSLDINNWNTSKVTNIGGMFYDCSSLTTLDLSNWDTSKVQHITDTATGTFGVFRDCINLKSIYVTGWDTSRINSYAWLFYNCSKLTTLDVSNFNTSNATNMRNMFYNCDSLTTLNLSNFNTTNVTNMDTMFYDCNSLTTLDISNFNMDNVTTTTDMFTNCSSLHQSGVTMTNCNEATKTKINGMVQA